MFNLTTFCQQQKNSKQWWLLLLLLVLLVGSWQYYRWQKKHQWLHDNQQLVLMTEIAKSSNWPKLINSGEELMQRHPDDLMGVLSAWLVSHALVEVQQLPQAIVTLQWIQDHSSDPVMQNLAKLQRALLFSLSDPSRTLSTLQSVDQTQWHSQYYLLKSFAQLSQHQWSAGRQSLSQSELGWVAWISPVANQTIWPAFVKSSNQPKKTIDKTKNAELKKRSSIVNTVSKAKHKTKIPEEENPKHKKAKINA